MMDDYFFRALRGGSLMLDHFLAEWEIIFEAQVVEDKVTSLAQTFCPSVKCRGRGAPTLHARVSGCTEMLQADGDTICIDIDVGVVDLALIRITPDIVALSLHADVTHFL